MRRDGLALAATVLLASAIPAGAAEYRAAVLRVDAPGRCRSRGSTCRPTTSASPARCSARPTTPPPARSWGRPSSTETVVATPETVEAEMQRLLDAGVWWIVTLADEDTTVRARRPGRRPGARRQRQRDRRPAARRGLPGEPAARRPVRRDARRCAGAVPGLEALDRLVPDRGQPPRGPGAGRGLSAGGDQVRRRPSSRSGCSRIPAARGAPTPATCRSRRRCRPSPSGRPRTTTLWSPPTASGCSPRTCRTTPGIRGRWRDRRGWCPRAGARRTRPGARRSGRRASRARRTGPRWDEDYQVWMALRVLGEAATRTQGGDFAAIRDFVRLGAVRPRRLQGAEADLPRLGRAAAPAGAADRRHGGGLGLAAGGVPAPGEPARHARDRPAGDHLHAIGRG